MIMVYEWNIKEKLFQGYNLGCMIWYNLKILDMEFPWTHFNWISFISSLQIKKYCFFSLKNKNYTRRSVLSKKMFLSRKAFNDEKPSSCIINYYSVKFPLKVLGINEVSSRREILNLLLKVQAHYIYMN